MKALIPQRWFSEHWQTLSPNERMIAGTLSAIVLLLLLAAVLWIPGQQARQRLALALPHKHAQLEQMKLQAARISELRHMVKLTQEHASDLKTTVQTSGRLHNMNSKVLSMEADQAGSVSLTLNASFTEWINWMDQLQSEHHIRVERCHIARTENGGVTIQATLTGPSSRSSNLAHE